MTSGAIALAVLAGSCSSGPDAPTAATGAPVHEAGAAAVDQARLIHADSEPGSWLAVGRTYSEQRFSPLKQINDKTVKGLGLAWYADMDTERGQESTPVIVDGVMYLTTAWSLVKAYDARTGAKLWEYDPAVDKAKGADACCDVVNRGVAAWHGKIYLAALDGRLIALDGKTGKEVWSTQTVPPGGHHTITGVPRIANGKVFIGNAGAEYDVRGYVSAYDAETGKQVWKWYTVPGDPSKPYENKAMEMAAKTWKGDRYWKLGGGATAWDGFLYDPATNLVYFGTGNGLAWAQELRSPGGGDNLFVSSIVALNADTGEYVWHYQETPGDEWDYDNTNPLMTADLPYPGGVRHVLMQASKNGFFYIMDAKTGKLVSAAKYAPATNWADHVDMTTGRPVINPTARYSSLGKPTLIAPAALGMHNWHPMAMSPVTGYVYIPVQVSAAAYAMKDDFKPNPEGTNTGTDFAGGQALCKAPGAQCGNIESYILAWDPVKEKEVWRVKNDVYGSSGILATAGNLIFSGNHKGEFAAYDATTGKRLWSADTQARVVAGASTYMLERQQYVAILVGARGLPDTAKRTNPLSANNSRVLVYRIGATETLPDTMTKLPPGAARIKIDPPLLTASNETVFAGEQAYAANCAMCHGPAVVPGAGSIAPDLRYSGLLPIRNGWDPTVRNGDRSTRGMPAFGDKLSKETTDAILAYVIKRANDEKAAQQAAASGSGH
ncbi:MAG: PQQ-dependent dehydrogenase, methanol/ethanol family [Alphaproteobacteria bacterium]|nr:PQQ-dependent dehydrogenase, methanol/ethanol family [Alphaproteobacteria bacterium]